MSAPVCDEVTAGSAQFADDPCDGAYGSPETRLMHAVLEQAAHDLKHCRDSRDPIVQRLYHDAWDWVTSHDQGHPFAFIPLCEALGYSASAVRARLTSATAKASDAPPPSSAALVASRAPRPPRPARPLRSAVAEHFRSRHAPGLGATARFRPTLGAALALLAGLTSLSVARAATVTIPEAAFTLGATPQVLTVAIDDAAGLEGADLRLAYDPAVVRLSGDAALTSLTAGCLVVSNRSTGVVDISLACVRPITGAGALLTIPVDGSTAGATDLVFTRCSLNEAALPCRVVPGRAVVQDSTASAMRRSSTWPAQ